MAYIYKLYAAGYIDNLYYIAYMNAMDLMARTPQQLGAAIRRIRRQQGLTQAELGKRMRARQATVSLIEAGHPGTTLRTLTDAIAALGIELVVRSRNKQPDRIEDIF